jgi:zinc finger-like protein
MKEILYLHAAIRTAMEAFTAEARALQKRGGFTSAQLGALVDRHRFLRSVCTYHQASEDEVLFPAAKLAPASSPFHPAHLRCLGSVAFSSECSEYLIRQLGWIVLVV